jgi:hypothetical protein
VAHEEGNRLLDARLEAAAELEKRSFVAHSSVTRSVSVAVPPQGRECCRRCRGPSPRL